MGTHNISTELSNTQTHVESYAEPMSETRLPISFQKNSFKDDVHHALYLRPLLLQLEEDEERHAEATQQVRHDTFMLASSLHR